jgi:hypothetical protein
VRWVLVLLLASCTGNAHTPPVEISGVRLFLLCLINCPLAINMADEGAVTDTVPVEHPHILSDNIRALNESDLQ